MNDPEIRIVAVEEGGYATDGGSVHLLVRDREGGRHEIVLVQHALPSAEAGRLAGRLYLDGVLVPIRSSCEHSIVRGLATAELVPPRDLDGADCIAASRVVLGDDLQDYVAAIDGGPTDALGWLVRRLIHFVVSEAYVDTPETPESFDLMQARRLRVATGRADRLHVLLALRRYLDVSPGEARALLDGLSFSPPEDRETLRELRRDLERIGARLAVAGSEDE